jgi:hypothetical protein
MDCLSIVCESRQELDVATFNQLMIIFEQDAAIATLKQEVDSLEACMPLN